MTEIEAQDLSAAKVQQINDLAKKLQVRIIAQQIIKGNVIENSVCFIDQEQYDIDKPKPVLRGPNVPKDSGAGMGAVITEVEKQDAKSTIA